MPDVLKLSFSFIIILFLIRKKLDLGYVMLIASALISILYLMDPGNIIKTVVRASTSGTTIKLLLALSLIRIFELVLREKNVLSKMTSAVSGFVGNRRVVIVSMPVLIGMLPSLGGAYFSAPMVKEATSGLRMSGEEKAFINYWFRHPWEFILPLYPGILLASAISGIPLHSLIAANVLYALVLVAMGFVYSMRDIGRYPAVSASDSEKSAGSRVLLKDGLSFIPVVAVLFLVVFARMELHYALLAMVIGLLIFFRYSPYRLPKIIKYGFDVNIIVLIFGTLLFKEMMENSGAVNNLSKFFMERGIPSLPLVCVLPFLTGLLTGMTIGFVGSTFPLLIHITGGSTAAMSLAFASGFLGVLLSPVHVCLVLSREYFNADLWGIYKKIMPAGTFIFIAAFAEFIFLR